MNDRDRINNASCELWAVVELLTVAGDYLSPEKVAGDDPLNSTQRNGVGLVVKDALRRVLSIQEMIN